MAADDMVMQSQDTNQQPWYWYIFHQKILPSVPEMLIDMMLIMYK